MWRFVSCVWLPVMCLLFQRSGALFETYQRNYSLPKCCDPDRALFKNMTENVTLYSCVDFPWRTNYFVSNIYNNSILESCSAGEECIDYQPINNVTQVPVKYSCGTLESLDIRDENILPKCCTPRFSYDVKMGACRADNEMLLEMQEGSFYIHSGLPNCASLVVDHELTNLEEITVKQDLSIDWNGGNYTWGNYCFDKQFGSEDYVLKVCEKDFSKCKTSPEDTGYQCIRKCCPQGQHYLSNKKCGTDKRLQEQGYDFHGNRRISLSDNVAFIHGITCRKYLALEHEFNYTVDEAGILHLYLDASTTWDLPATTENYCFERVFLNRKQRNYVDYMFLCFKSDTLTKLKLNIITIIVCISSVCLFITFTGYLILPEMQNLHGRTLMVHCFSLMAACICLAVVQFALLSIHTTLCITMGYMILFWFLAAFTWLNIMCFDIWWTFGSMRVQGIGQKKRERRRFILYNVYGWLYPLFFTSFAFCAQTFNFLPENLTPDVGRSTCFLSRNNKLNFAAYCLFFIMPITFLILCNSILFARTTYYCYKVKSEISRMKDSNKSTKEKKKLFNADRERLGVIFKLFVIMGISWIFEGISAFFPQRKALPVYVLEVIVDSYNASEGILIFCVFMVKRKILKSFQKKFFKGKQGKISSQNTTNTSVNSIHSLKVNST